MVANTKTYIALAHVKSEYSQNGTILDFELKIEHFKGVTPAKVVKTPFFDHEGVHVKVNKYDAIIIGGGHNGLTAAAYLSKAGRKVLVLERHVLVVLQLLKKYFRI